MSENILDILKKELAIKRLTLDDLSEKTDITRSKIHNYLSGRTRLELNAFIDICKAIEISPSQVIAEYTKESTSQSEDLNVDMTEIEESEEEEPSTSEHVIEDLSKDLIYIKAKYNIKSEIIREIQSSSIKDLFLLNCRNYIKSIYPIKFDNGEPIPDHNDTFSSNEEKLIKEGINLYNKYKTYEFNESQLKDLIEITSSKYESILEEYREFRELLTKVEKSLKENKRYLQTRLKLKRARNSSNIYIQELYEKHQAIISKYSAKRKRSIRKRRSSSTPRTSLIRRRTNQKKD